LRLPRAAFSSSVLVAREPHPPPPVDPALAPWHSLTARHGKLNAITDVAGSVGFTTLISGEGKTRSRQGPVRTGVTAVIPRGHDS
jgi:hypothetical protein